MKDDIFFRLEYIWAVRRSTDAFLRAAKGTWNFVRHLATLAQGSASEAHMNMDVNLCRLPEKNNSQNS
ncbi:hypothetical protein ACTQ1U_04295 [Thermoguttaceae bacterium LCP21S3_D4]